MAAKQIQNGRQKIQNVFYGVKNLYIKNKGHFVQTALLVDQESANKIQNGRQKIQNGCQTNSK